MANIDASLFNADQHALESAYGRCPKCDSNLAIKHSKNGPFIGCVAYPSCDFSKPLHEHTNSVVKVMEDSKCPECGAKLAIKKGRFGLFIGCTHFPECHHIESPTHSIATHVQCPSCQEGELKERTNKYGKRFFACDRYPKCRYILNFEPIDASCPDCGWTVLINKKIGQKKYKTCPQKDCGYKEEQQ